MSIRVLGYVACIALSFAAYRGTQAAPAPSMRAAARAFEASLSSEQRARAWFPYDDAQRRDWHFVPRERRGVPLSDLNTKQRELGRELLLSALSARGLRAVDDIVELEDVLKELESNPGRDRGRYFFSLFGDLEGSSAFGWRFEGHHVSLNFSNLEPLVWTTPHFLGASPATVEGGVHAGSRALAREEDLGRALALGFEGEARALALLAGTPPADVLLSPGHDELLAASGITLAAMSAEQQARFWELAEVYIGRFDAAQAELERSRMRALDPRELRFVWIGSLQPRQPHYYRIQGPRFAIEYDNTQNGANHVHTLWRDLDHDFGDALREHRRSEHGEK
ncbi:MAG: DUF3500 domain-containing protein [Planctomycetes bacterium]|nr:DUF3500 domain-containing protein [Planctomycetota bacterium]